MEKLHSIAQANCQIGLTVIVEVSSRTTQTTTDHAKSGFPGPVLKSAIAEIAQQAAGAVRGATNQKKIGLAVAVVVEEAGAGTWSGRVIFSTRCFGHKRVDLLRKAHRNCRRHIDNGVQRQLRERVTALIAVTRAERRSEMLRGDFLEARQVLSRGSSVALPLKRAGQSEFRRRMKRI